MPLHAYSWFVQPVGEGHEEIESSAGMLFPPSPANRYPRGEVFEAGPLGPEEQLDLASRAIAMLGQVQGQHVGRILPMQEHHHVSILLDRAAVPQIGEPRF